MTKNRQNGFSNGKIRTQKKSLTLKEVRDMSLADAYAIVGGYKHIPAKSAEMRILIYKRAVEMVQKDDAQFAKLLQEDRAKPNQKVKQALDLTEAYNIVGGYVSVDKKTFKQAIEILRADTTDPKFAALLIKFAESHSSFSDADDETLTKINEKGLAFFDNLDINKVIENVSKDKEVQQAQNATPVTFNTDTPEAAKVANELAQSGIIYAAATDVAMNMDENGASEQSVEEEIKNQTIAREAALRLDKINEDREEAVIEAIKSNSDKPLSKFRQKMKNAWDFTKKISISQESVKNVCDKAQAKWNKFARKVSISVNTGIATAEYTLHQMKPRGKAAVLAGLMMVTTFIGCTSNNKGNPLTQANITAIQKDSIDKARLDSIDLAKAQELAAIENAKKEAAKKEAAHRDSIMSMEVPHEWNASMKTIRSQKELDKILNFYNKEDSARYDRMYRNLALIQDSLPTFKLKGDSVASQVDKEAVMKRIFQHTGFPYQIKLDEQGNPVVDKNGKAVYEASPTYAMAQNLIQLLNRPCDGNNFNPADIKQSDLQLLFDNAVQIGTLDVQNPYASKPDCGDDVEIRVSVQTPKKEVKEENEVKEKAKITSDGSDNTQEEAMKLGIAFNNYEEVNTKEIKAVELTKRNTSTDSDGRTTAVTNKGSATVGEALEAGKKAADNTGSVFVSEDNAQVNAKNASDLQLGVANSKAKTDSISAVTSTPDLQLGVAGGNASGDIANGATTLTKQNVSTNDKGDVTAVTKVGESSTGEAVKTGENAASNSSVVYSNTSSTATTTYTTSTATADEGLKLGVAGEIKSDTTAVASDSVKNAQAASTFTSDINNNNFTLPVDTIGWDILRPENDSIPVGAPSALGEKSGRGGLDFTSVSQEQIKDDKNYYGDAAYEKGIERFSQHPEFFVYGGPLEGLTPQQAMNGLRRAMQWSVTKYSDFAKFRPQVLAMMNFVKDCKDTFTVEETQAIKDLYAAIHVNGTIDDVIGRNNIQNTSYTFGKDCGEKGQATFVTTNDANPTNPSGPYFEQVYMTPLTKQVLMLGIASDNTYEEVNITEIKDVNLYKRNVSTASNGTITGITNKGSSTVGAAINAGENAANNTSGVYVSQDQAPKSLTKAEQKAAKKKAKEEAKKKAREEALMKDPNTNPYLQHWVQTK